MARPKRACTTRKRSYVEEEHEESSMASEQEDSSKPQADSDAQSTSESDIGDDSGYWDPSKPNAEVLRPTFKKRKIMRAPTAKSNKKVKKEEEKPFRFLDLPPELRNNIYELALTDNGRGMSLCTFKSGSHYSVHRGVVASKSWAYGNYGRRSIQRLDANAPIQSPFGHISPALLRVNKQINAEAVPILYGQTFFCQDFRSLEEFLSMIGHQNRKLLSNLVMMYWDTKADKNLQARSAINWLMNATNLQSLYLDCSLGRVRDLDVRARQIYFAAAKFIDAYGAAHRQQTAAVDIIRLCKTNFAYDHYAPWHNPPAYRDAEANEARFVDILTRLASRA